MTVVVQRRRRTMVARIFRPAKTAMQSGKAGTRAWVLRFEPSARKSVEPLMGWTGSEDMLADEVILRFASREEAVAYAEREGLDYVVEQPATAPPRPKSYAQNFRWDRPR
jgi:hypothetical protein